MDHGIVHFEIPATDPDKLSGFYRDLFDWQINKMSLGETDYWIAMTSDSDENGTPKQPGMINGGMYQRQDPQQSPVNYVSVESVDEYVTKAKGLGAKVITDKMPVPAMGWFALLTDPDGNTFGVWQTDMSAA